MIRLFHRHRYDLRETRSDGRYLVCACGSAVPMLTRDKPVEVTPPAHETMKAKPHGTPFPLDDIVSVVWDGQQLYDVLAGVPIADPNAKKVH